MSRLLSIQLKPGSSPMTLLGEEKPRLKMFCCLLSSSKKLLYFMVAFSFMIFGSSIIQFRKEIFSKILNSVRLNSIDNFIIIKDILFSNQLLKKELQPTMPGLRHLFLSTQNFTSLVFLVLQNFISGMRSHWWKREVLTHSGLFVGLQLQNLHIC